MGTLHTTLLLGLIFTGLCWKVFAQDDATEPDQNQTPCSSDEECETISSCSFCYRGECVAIPGCKNCTIKTSVANCGVCGVCALDNRCSYLDADCKECDEGKLCDRCQTCSELKGPGKCKNVTDCHKCGEQGDKPCPPCMKCNKAGECVRKIIKGQECQTCDPINPVCPPCMKCNKAGECVPNGKECQTCNTPRDCTGICQTCKDQTCVPNPNCKKCDNVDDCDGPCQFCVFGECLAPSDCPADEDEKPTTDPSPSSGGKTGPSKAAWVLFSVGMCVVAVVVVVYVWREFKRYKTPIRSIGNQYDVINRSSSS